MVRKEKLKKAIPGLIFDEPLKNHTTLNVGGPARFFLVAKKTEEIIKAIRVAKSYGLRFLVLGGGSNLLFLDKGFDGLIIKNDTGGLEQQEESLIVDSGYNLHGVVRYACKHDLSGMEKVSWIPGSIGGAVYGNAGAYGMSIGDLVKEVEAYDLDKDKILTLKNSDCQFIYRSSVFKKQGKLIILKVNLQLSLGDRDSLESQCNDIKKLRDDKHPRLPSAGSFFKNVEKKDLRGNKKVASLIKALEIDKIPAGLLIDRVGLKGFSVGGAKISEKHANFIVNSGNASADDIIKLMDIVKTRVRDKYSIQLESEVIIVN